MKRNKTGHEIDDKLSTFLSRHDEPAPPAPAGEWAALRRRIATNERASRSLWRLPVFPAGLAAAAMLALVIVRMPTETAEPDGGRDEQIESLLADDSYFDDDELFEGAESYLALLAPSSV